MAERVDVSEQWLKELLGKWEGRLLRYACRYVKAEVAAEIVQEAFLRAWRAPANIVGHEKEWLFHVCRNLAIDHLRREKRVVLLVEEGGVLVPETEESLQRHEELTHLQRLAAALPPAQREVVRLKFQEEMSYQEISRVTGHSVSYVGVLIHLAMTAIRKQAQKIGDPK